MKDFMLIVFGLENRVQSEQLKMLNDCDVLFGDFHPFLYTGPNVCRIVVVLEGGNLDLYSISNLNFIFLVVHLRIPS